MALDERGLGIDAILVTILETATATVKHVIITAARGWRFAASCLPSKARQRHRRDPWRLRAGLCQQAGRGDIGSDCKRRTFLAYSVWAAASSLETFSMCSTVTTQGAFGAAALAEPGASTRGVSLSRLHCIIFSKSQYPARVPV